MAKRRAVRPQESDEEEEVKETAEERRARRDRDRRSKKSRGDQRHRLMEGRPRWQRGAAYLGVAVAVIAAVAVIFLYIPHPCLSISAPPTQSGTPSETAWSWCVNSTDAIEEQMTVHLTITINGTDVGIPGGIGYEPAGHWTNPSTGPSQDCYMPVYTLNSTGTTAGESGGYIEIASPWAFTYDLADFFSLWEDSYPTVSVAGISEPVEYSGTQIFNDKSGQGHDIVQLWVDGQKYNNSNGPNLVLNYLADDLQLSSEDPQCFVSQYGSGHSIEITWATIGSGEGTSGPTLFQASGATAVPLPPEPAPHPWGALPQGAIPPALVGFTGCAVPASLGVGPPKGPGT